MTLKDRVRLYCERKNMAITKFEREAKLSNGYFKESTSRIGDDKIERIRRAFPDLNIDWLLTGNGEMLVAEQSVAQITTSGPMARIEQAAIVREDEKVEVDIEALMKEQGVTIASLAATINESVDYIRSCGNKLYPHHILLLQGRFGDEVVDRYSKYSNVVEVEIVESFPVLPEEVTTSPNTDIVKFVEENGSELETINPNLLLSNAKVDVAERIKRTSMLPTFQPEDIVFIRFIKDKMKIVDGETYYLDCKNRPTMIRLVKFEPDGKLRLIAKNSQYGDIIIDRCDIINIGVVVALFRMTFGDQYSELEALRREKEAEREKKDSQIDKMLEMMQAQGEQQSKLIDYITRDK